MTATLLAPADHRAWLDLLAGGGAADVLAAALAADGAELDAWTIDGVHARPGAEVTVGYDVVARRGSGPAARTAREHLFATSAAAGALGPVVWAGGAERGVVRLDSSDRSLHVWRHPHDPALPGLAAGSTPARVADRLRSAGVDAEVVALETVTYRPLRRAVLRARTDGAAGPRTVYVKVVRPSRVRDLVRRHDLFFREPDGRARRAGRGGPDASQGGAGRALAAPRVLSWTADGVVLLSEVPGESVAARVAATPALGQQDAVDPAEILRAAAGLPAAGVVLARRPAWADRLDRYASALPVVHDVDPGRVARLARRIGAVAAGRDPGPVVTTHGDLHAANLLLAPDAASRWPRVGAVLDVDTLGPGHRVDDLACAVAHLAVLPTLAPGTYAGVGGLLDAWLEAFDAAVDPALLRSRAAAVVVSLAVGAADAGLATAWLAVAEDLVDGAASS
ncbi:hypothetical protein GCM10009809_09610 [Isoptericola hypogeus]|uniref:Phosphotransferase enzyme family protein n=1 Tax=Isoptericola hypogeus TaxID=300179 RepID=A0ABP4V345_9MICO